MSISPEFRDALSGWAEGMISRSDRLISLKQRIDSLEHSITWWDKQIKLLEDDNSRKQHNKQKTQLRYQKRHAEIDLAFCLAEFNSHPLAVRRFYNL